MAAEEQLTAAVKQRASQSQQNGQHVAETGKKGERQGGTLYVPAGLFAQIPEGTRFRCELIEEGVLFRRIDPAAVPTWAIPPE